MILFLLLLFTSSLTTHGTDLQMYGQDKLYGKVASKLPKQGGRAYKYLNYGEIEIELKRLAKLYPDLITVYSAQQEYNVPSPGSCGDAGPCKQWYARITNEKTLFVEDVIPTNSQTGPGEGPPGNGPPGNGPPGQGPPPGQGGPGQGGPGSGAGPGDSHYKGGKKPDDIGPPHHVRRHLPSPNGKKSTTTTSKRPEVFFSGSVHGNERVGPTATIELARLLLENYNYGQNSWLKHLVDTRIIFIMPCANALGYYQNKREENGIDPNRDFPYGKFKCKGERNGMVVCIYMISFSHFLF